MLQIGDTVTLNSGGLVMKIVRFDGTDVVVKYETEDIFPLPCVRIAAQSVNPSPTIPLF